MKGRKKKEIFSRDRYQWEGGGQKGRVYEGVYGRCVLHPYVKI
jgi:hypothetical protein